VDKDQQVFSGGVAVITGAGAGIGAGLARRAGSLGMTVVVTDRDSARAAEVAGQIIAAGGRAEAIAVDVSNPAALDTLADAVFARHGAVRLLINNAGIETIGYSWEIPAERWEATLNTNIHGVVHGVRAFVPRMLASGCDGWIGNLASIGAFGVMPAQTAYIMTKHAVQSFSECLYLELQLKKAPIHVSSIVPGMVQTSIFEDAAGIGEPADAAVHRRKMREMMATGGMDLESSSRSILAQMADRRFWVHTQPEMTQAAIESRIAFLRGQNPPQLNEQVRFLVEP
jgi:NAD(P)-dependent dehydrogenase (short-subunit alcohol dehydrogenase family)